MKRRTPARMLLDRIPVRFRLSVGHAFWMALVFLAVGYGLFRVVEHNLYQSVDGALMTSAKSIRDTRFVRGFGPPLMERFLSQFFGERYIRLYAQLVDLSGNISAKTDRQVNLPVTPVALANAEKGQHTLETFRRQEVPIRLITLPVMKFGKFTGELIQVAAPLDNIQHTLRGITWVLWVALPTGLILSVVFGYLLTARALKPVQELSEAASKMSSDDLSVRLPIPEAKDELSVLTHTFNEMLNRLDDAFKRLRRFTGDVSHELRTPLAVLRGEAELALRRVRTPEQYQEALSTIVRESANMTGIVEDLLLLARAESKSVAITWDIVNLSHFVNEVVRSVAKIYEEKGVTLQVAQGGHTDIEVSSNFLALAIKNILINAAKHSNRGSLVHFRILQADKCTIFTIQDHGEGIPEGSLPYIFDPFYRADTARNRAAGGAGIGLSLAQALVRLHGGSIEAQSQPGKGALFKIKVPTIADPAIKAASEIGRAKETRLIANKAPNAEASPAKTPRQDEPSHRNADLQSGLPIL